MNPEMAYLAAKKLWHGLGPGPWVCDVSNPYMDGLIAEILELVGSPVKDYAGAEYRRRLLAEHRFLTVEHLDDGTLKFTKATKCPPKPAPEASDWVTQENRRLAKAHAEDLAWREREYQATKAAQEVLDAPIRAAEAAAFFRGLQQNKEAIRAMVKEVVKEVIAELQAAGV